MNSDEKKLPKTIASIALRLQVTHNHLATQNLYNPSVEDEVGAVRINDNLVAVPMVIPFDENGEPILNNEKHIADYDLMKELFTDPKVMETSSFNGGDILSGKMLNDAISSSVRQSEEQRESPYGLYKIFNKRLGQYVGVQGLIDTGLVAPYSGKKIVESLTFIKSKYVKNGYGRTITDWTVSEAKNREESLVFSVKIGNEGTKKLCTHHIPIHIGMKRIAGDLVDIFTIDYLLAQDISYCKKITTSITTASKINEKNKLNPEYVKFFEWIQEIVAAQKKSSPSPRL